MDKYDFEADLICTACNHAKRFHTGSGNTECNVITDRVDCSCIQFADPRQPVSKDYYYYADVPKGTDDPVKRPQGLVCPVCSHLFDNHRPTGMNWHIICDECPCWVDLMNLKQGDLRYARA